ncbi:SpaA isopeptide-forming pilin-related protein [Gemmiger sp.]|uniref:SpaA isopeptide-forming pilin-related protein n=1 Tax=Gemmiger sp. TaxID=2049027 RepID=UPI00351FC974
MYKHSTTHRTLSRRLAALLAVLALLAALALPVYAEAQTEDSTKIAETVETVNETETTDDTTASTDSDDPTDPTPADPTDDSTTAADDATDDATPSTDDTDTAPAGETTTDDTLDTSDEDTNNDGTDGANIENTGTADDAVAQPDNEVEDEVRVQEAAAKEVTIYFLAPSGFDTTATVKFHARIQGEQDHDNWYTAQMTDSGKADRNGRKIFFTTVYPEQGPSCPYSGYSKIEFITSTANGDKLASYWGLGQNSLEWTSVYTYADRIYDADAGTWTAYTPFDPNNHQTFAGKTMLFQNQSDNELTDVKAVFYEKTNGSLQPVETIDLKAIAVGKRVSFKIPEKDCTYIRFIVDGKETSLYNFYDQQDEGANNRHFLYDSGTACYVYKENDNGSSWTIPQGTITVYFDATFSSAYTEYKGAALSIPNGESKDVYCCFKNDSEGTTSNAQKMTSLGNDLYSVEVPGGYSEIMFSGDSLTSPANSGISTDWVSIDWKLKEPCYVADTNDAVVYNSGASRGGYWTEKDDVRDAEARKGTTVVDIDNTTPFVRNSATKYVNSTLYDYYTDWELNGKNRDDYDKNFSVSDRSWVPFRQFDLALSDYYKTSGNSSNDTDAVKYPIYTGHFQPSEYGFYNFVDLYNQLQMNLFGFGEGEGRKFMVDNNSSLCTKDNEKNHGNLTVQGIVADDATNTSKDGLPVMRGTENSSKPLVEPHFNTEFLLGTNSKHTKLGEVYKNVAFPFTQNDVFGDGIKYWSFDAAETTLYLKQDKDDDSYFLQSSTNKKASKNRGADSTEKGETGFFPFNETVKDGASANNYNYGFGARLQFDFTLTDDGMVEGNEGKKPIRFFFSGDDDVWVFIDGKLALDVGGAHAKASGLLEFSVDGSSEYATAYVSGVKAGGTSEEDVRTGSTLQVKYKPSENASEIPIEFNYKGKTINLKKGTTHTLTMYYMERGMWESNMAVAFNFPDYNELQVKKEVDVNGVNGLFKNCFKDKRFFNFTIRNQATHYGTNDAKGDTVTTINLLEPDKSTSEQKDFTTTATHAPGTSGENRFEIVKNPPNKLNVTDGTPLLNWYTQFEDLTPSPGSNKNKRYGILTLDKPIDITGMSYLSFDVYVDSEEGDAALSNMYLELRDNEKRQKGCLGKTFIGGKDLYGQVEMHNNQWITVKLSLGDVKAEKDFDEKHVKELRFGCNYPRSIYLRNIVFSSKAVPQTVTGFTTKQQDIADYGSAQEGELMPAVNAQYTSDAEKGTMVVDKNGGFVLKAGETISFKDQFRRGSYLSINEQVDKNLFDTQWTIYEDGKAVNEIKAGTGNKLTLDVNHPVSLKDQTGTAPDDGRIENVNAEDNAQNGNSYKGEKPSTKNKDDNTIVFRSYANPDATDADGETQLKVVFVNTVKTGSLTIVKQQAKGSDPLKGTYHFKVRFTNVGGHALEDEAIEETYPVTVDKPFTIDNIPVGTRFTIEEVTPLDGSKLTKVSVTGGGSGTMVLNNQTVRGSIVAGDENKAVATFTNTKQETLDITGEKVWKNADNSLMTEHPATIYVQLQRRCVGETSELSWTPVTYLNETYTRVEQKYEGMKFSFLGLPAKDYDGGNQTPYEYRVVEGSVDNKGVFQAVDDEKTITIGEKVYSVTYKYTASKPDDSSNNNAKQTVTITNTQQDPKFTLDVTKKSAENDGENDKQKLLEGVEFTLEKLDENGQVDTSFETKTGITDGQGVLKLKNSGGSTSDKAFADLEAGTYRLTETKTAEGYNLLSAPIVITFTKDGQCRIGNDALMQAKNDTIFTGDAVNGYKLALTVLNRKTPALPHTGADAPSLWLLIGLPLAVAGLLILVFRYNKKGGRTR